MMEWQFSGDSDSSKMNDALSGLIKEEEDPVTKEVIKFAVVDTIASQNSDSDLLESLGVPVD